MEDRILNRIAIDQALSLIDPADREMLILVSALERPGDWLGSWPPKFSEIAEHIGMKYYDKPLSEATIRYRLKMLQQMWQGKRGPLRRVNRSKYDRK